MSGKIKHVRGNLYSVIWRDDEAHGHYRRVKRIIALNGEDAIKSTKPENAKSLGSVLVSVDLLCEDIQIRVSDPIFNYFSGMAHADLYPYTNADFREMLRTDDSGR